VKTGDGPTKDGNGAARHDENVIRLPRDWLGPPEELVPIGPAARARAAQLDGGDVPPPAADAFWSEDAAALHDAVQAPVGAAADRLSPPVDLVAPPVAAQWHLRLPRRPRLPGVRGPRVVRVRWALVAVAAAVLAVPAVLALGARPAGPRSAAHAGPVHAQTQSGSTALAQDSAALESGPLPKTDAAAHGAHRTAAFLARTRARRNMAVRHRAPTKSRHRPAATHHSATPTVTDASASPATTTESTPASTAPAVSDRSSATASTAGSQGSKPSTSSGPIGIGSFTGQCNPRCP
jgi:hypothetical protein